MIERAGAGKTDSPSEGRNGPNGHRPLYRGTARRGGAKALPKPPQAGCAGQASAKRERSDSEIRSSRRINFLLSMVVCRFGSRECEREAMSFSMRFFFFACAQISQEQKK